MVRRQKRKAPDGRQKADRTMGASGAEKSTAAVELQEATSPKTDEEKPPVEPEPHKVVVRHGGAPEPRAQIVPDLPPEQAIEQRKNADEMLVGAEDRLRLLGARTLDLEQQETVTQIRNYMAKARAALKDGDTQRGHTLALKAYLLADDLVKH
jgi:hypothetical protein